MRRDLYNNILKFFNNPDKGDKIFKDLSKEDLYLCDKCFDDIEKKLSQPTPDYEKIWDEIDSRTSDSKFNIVPFLKNAIRYAAIIIIALSISVLSWYMYNDFTGNDELSYAQNRKKVLNNNEASLILGNGKVIELSGKNTGKIINTELVQISNDSNKIVTYKEKSDTIIKPQYNTIVVPRGAEYSIKLSDGTVVCLNSESSLKYPVRFCGSNRKVFLKGEAYFRVSKNKHKPFIVKVGDMNVKVLGTIFNVNAYKENDGITTTLVEGKVKVSGSNKYLILKPNQQAIFSNNNIVCKDVDIFKYTSWIDGKFYFEDMPLEKVMAQIERWCDINVFFVNQEIKDYLYTGVIKKECSLEQILRIIKDVAGIKIRLKDNRNVYIEKI